MNSSRLVSLVVLCCVLNLEAISQCMQINEIRHANVTNSFVEVRVSSPSSSCCANHNDNIKIHVYSGGTGQFISLKELNGVYDGSTSSCASSGYVSGQGYVYTSGYSYYQWSLYGQHLNPNLGFVLVCSGNIIEFISYGGSFTATDGIAAGLTSSDVGVTMTSTNSPFNYSLQKLGNTWTGPVPYSTPQTPSSCGENLPQNDATFANSQLNVTEGSNNLQVCLNLNPINTAAATSVEVSVSSSSSANLGVDYSGISSTETLVFPAGSNTPVCMNLDIADNAVPNDGGKEIVLTITDINNYYGSSPYPFNPAYTATITIADNDDNDMDNIANINDNCPNVYNPLQEDLDLDGIGNVCDNDQSPLQHLLEVDSNVFLNQLYSGVIVKSPDGNCWQISVDNNGTVHSLSVTCP